MKAFTVTKQYVYNATKSTFSHSLISLFKAVCNGKSYWRTYQNCCCKTPLSFELIGKAVWKCIMVTWIDKQANKQWLLYTPWYLVNYFRFVKVPYLNQETAKVPFWSTSQAATSCYLIYPLDHVLVKICIKGALNPNFLNLTIEKNFGTTNVLVPFFNLRLLKSYEIFKRIFKTEDI